MGRMFETLFPCGGIRIIFKEKREGVDE